MSSLYPKQMPKFKSREEAYNRFLNTPYGIWEKWIRSIAVKNVEIDKTLYHLSTDGNHPGKWYPQEHYLQKDEIPRPYDGSTDDVYREILPFGISTSDTYHGCWAGIYPNLENMFATKEGVKYVDVGNLFIYEVKANKNALVLTPHVLNKYFLIWDAYYSQEYRFLDPIEMRLVSLMTFKNTTGYSNSKKSKVYPFNDMKYKKDHTNYVPPLEIITNQPIHNKRNKHMSIYSTESFEVPNGVFASTTSNAKIMHQLSMEASINPLAKLHSGIKDKFLILLDNISEFNDSISNAIKGTNKFNTYKLKLNHAADVTKTNYVTHMDQQLDVPEGFKGPYNGYAKLVLDTLKDFDNLDDTTTKPCAQTLSIYLSNPDKLKSLTLDINKSIDNKSVTMNEYKSNIQNYFDENSTSNTATYGQLFTNNADFVSSARIAKDIENYLTNSKTRKQLQRVSDDIDEISNLVDKLIVRVKQDENTYGLNTRTAQTLAIGIDAIAEVVTFYGALLHMAEEAHGVIYLACEKLK